MMACAQGSNFFSRQAIFGPPPYTRTFTCSRSRISGAKVAETFPSIPNQSFVKYVTELLTPMALALKIEFLNLSQSTPIPSCQRKSSRPPYRNLGSGAGDGEGSGAGMASGVAKAGGTAKLAAGNKARPASG